MLRPLWLGWEALRRVDEVRGMGEQSTELCRPSGFVPNEIRKTLQDSERGSDGI